MSTVSDSNFTGGYGTDWTYTSTFPATTTTSTTTYTGITNYSYGTVSIPSVWTTGPQMMRWGNQVFLDPSPKMRTLLTALQLL